MLDYKDLVYNIINQNIINNKMIINDVLKKISEFKNYKNISYCFFYLGHLDLNSKQLIQKNKKYYCDFVEKGSYTGWISKETALILNEKIKEVNLNRNINTTLFVFCYTMDSKYLDDIYKLGIFIEEIFNPYLMI